jgi:transcriptional regulator with XRE-family HTH domain
MGLSDPPSLRLRLDVRNRHNAASACDMDAQGTLTRNVKAWLAFTGRSQAELAAHLKVTQGYVSLLLNGKRPWQVDLLDGVADFLCVSVPLLFAETGDGRVDRRSGVERRARRERRNDKL